METLLSSQGVSFTEVQEGLEIKREISALRCSALLLPVGLPAPCFLCDFTMFWSLDKSLLVQDVSESYMWEQI